MSQRKRHTGRLADVLRLYRLWKDVGMRDLATEIGVSASTICRLERGEVADWPTMWKLMKWLLDERP